MRRFFAFMLLTICGSAFYAAPASAMTSQEYQQSLDAMASPNYRPPPAEAPAAHAIPPAHDAQQDGVRQRMIRKRDAMTRAASAANGHYDAEYPYLEKADAGDMKAVVQLGRINEYGLGKVKDLNRAAFWYSKGVDRRDSSSLSSLVSVGDKFRDGDEETEPDYDTAMHLYLQAYNAGYSPAGNHIGEMYDKGLGVPVDPGSASFWCAKAKAETLKKQRRGRARKNITDIPF